MKFERTTARASADLVLAVDAGRVGCPRQGIVDVERCWACPDFDGLSGGRAEGVVCNANLEDVAVGFRPAVR